METPIKPATPTPQPPKSNLMIWIIILGLLVVALAGGMVYFYLQMQEKTQQNTELKEDKVDLEQEIQDLDTKMKKLDEELSNRDVTLDEKERQVRKLMSEISRYQARVNQLMSEGKMQKDELDRYRGMYEQLEYYNEKYRAEIERLQAENDALRQQLANRDSTLQTVTTKQKELSQQVEQMETQRNAAAVLRLDDFRYNLMKTNGKEIENKGKEVKYRSNTNFRICFKVLPNNFAPKGNTTFYVVIKGPGGVWKSFNTSSGYFTYQKKETAYSVKGNINYEGETAEVCMIYQRPDTQTFEKGRYEVVVYANGVEVGKDSFTIR